MTTDVKLDEIDGTYVVLDARVVKALGADFMLQALGAVIGKALRPLKEWSGFNCYPNCLAAGEYYVELNGGRGSVTPARTVTNNGDCQR